MFVFNLSKKLNDVLTNTNPNNNIIQSDKNTFKILAKGLLTAQSVTSDPTTFSIAHGLTYAPAFYAFAQFPDGKVALPNAQDFSAQPYVSNGYGYFNLECDEDNLYFIFTKFASNYNVNISWFIFEAPVVGTPPSDLPTGFKLAMTKEGIDYFDANSPDDFIYNSGFDTLKYETQGTIDVDVNLASYYHTTPNSPPIFPTTYENRNVETIAHGLGYVPFFAGYSFDIPTAGKNIQSPFYFGDFIFFAAEAVYADATNLYFLSQFNTTSNSGSIVIPFGYRIFKNDLGF